MRTFDAGGITWQVVVDVPNAAKVKRLLHFDLLNVAKDQAACEQLADDPELFVNVLFVLCQEQAERERVSDEDFGHLMSGDVFDAATIALLESLTDFFPKRRATFLRKILERAKTHDEAVLDRLETMCQPGGELDRLLDNALQIPGTPLSGTPVQSVAIPTGQA